jgi:hypothetical protein
MKRKTIIQTLVALSIFVGGYWSGMSQTAGHVYELRTYTANPGKLGDLNKRFRDHTLEIFKRHGMTNVAYFTPEDKPLSENTLVYLLRHDSRDAAKKSWDDFRNDPEWKKVSAASEENGKIVDHVVSQFLVPTDYSPVK